MPYLKYDDKEKFTKILKNMEDIFFTIMPVSKLVAGILNYLFTKIAHIYIDVKGENYQAYNDVIGALEGAKLELYRRRIALYEDKKIEENGDV